MPEKPSASPKMTEQKGSCPCEWTEPCHPRCTCVNPASSYGCTRCCKYGSDEQRKMSAERLSDDCISIFPVTWPSVPPIIPTTSNIIIDAQRLAELQRWLESEAIRIEKNGDLNEMVLKLLEALVSIGVLEQVKYTIRTVEYSLEGHGRKRE